MKPTKLQKKISKILIALAIPLILVGVVLMGYETITGGFKGIIRNILVTIMVVYMITFTIFMFLTITKWKKEFEIGDDNPYFNYFGNSLLIFITLFGLSEVLIYKNWSGFNSIIIGVLFLILSLRIKKR